MRRLTLATIGFLLFFSSLASAQGLLIPPSHPPRPPIPPLPLKYQHVRVKIDNQIALTQIEQVFLNEYDRDLEAEYIFALPPGAMITEFAMWIDGKKVKAELMDSDRARQIFWDIVSRMKDPGLLQYLGRDTFRVNIYPIPAHGEKKIQLSYSQELKYAAGLVNYTCPTDRGRLEEKPTGEISILVELTSRVPIKSIYSPSHKVDITRHGEHKAAISYESGPQKQDRNFSLYYSLSEEEFGLTLIPFRKGDEQPGYFLMLIAPKVEIQSSEIGAKDVVFVLDSSGSMQDDNKIVQAIKALKFGVGGLNRDDRFNIIHFSTEPRLMAEALVPADEVNKRKATKFIEAIEAKGGTNINDTLLKAIGLFSENRRPQILVFLTDGRPTVGVTDVEEIIKNVGRSIDKQIRLFTFGLGYDVNTLLLDALAASHRGASDYIKPGEDMELIVSSFFDKVNYPVLDNLSLDFAKIKVEELYPMQLPAIFKGSQLTILGRYASYGSTSIRLSGEIGGKKRTLTYKADFPRKDKEADFIPRLWATRKIGYLLDQIRLHGEDKELKDEVISLSKEYGVVTPYTSYLALGDEKPIPRPGERLYEESKVKADLLAARKAPVGQEAVQFSAELNLMKEMEKEAREASETIRYVGDKTFYLRKEVWVDSEFQEGMETIPVEFGSDDYFKLLTTHPELGRYFAIGKKVIVVYAGKVYEVIAPEEKEK
ncbi:trypsin [bacterium (candidate division B38) B3_B38]|nr:MAG: trypsin [bacterium (candidate division B38) B3_B38]